MTILSFIKIKSEIYLNSKNNIMPIKHQSKSYRNRNGKRYISYSDISVLNKTETINEGIIQLRNLRAIGTDCFGEYHKDGYYRIFILDSE